MKIKFETKACGRCGDSGRYSWNQMHGDRCFGCSGSGKKLTPAGKKAAARYNDLMRKASTVPALFIKPGDSMKIERAFVLPPAVAPKVWRRVKAVELTDGGNLHVEFFGKGDSWNMSPMGERMRHPGMDRVHEIMEQVAGRLKGAEVVEE